MENGKWRSWAFSYAQSFETHLSVSPQVRSSDFVPPRPQLLTGERNTCFVELLTLVEFKEIMYAFAYHRLGIYLINNNHCYYECKYYSEKAVN